MKARGENYNLCLVCGRVYIRCYPDSALLIHLCRQSHLSCKTSNRTLVLVHGSWHCPEHFGPLVDELTSHGYKCVPVPLPTTQSPDLPPRTFGDDTSAVRDTVLAELEHNDVVVVCHSYGGAPTNNALRGLGAEDRAAAGSSTAVGALVFLCSIPLPKGGEYFPRVQRRGWWCMASRDRLSRALNFGDLLTQVMIRLQRPF